MSRDVCTCDPEDFGPVGHGEGCPVGRRNELKTVRYAYELMAARGVPGKILEQIRVWLAEEEAVDATSPEA